MGRPVVSANLANRSRVTLLTLIVVLMLPVYPLGAQPIYTQRQGRSAAGTHQACGRNDETPPEPAAGKGSSLSVGPAAASMRQFALCFLDRSADPG
jgi:zona occludens toxin (predicted ATPase)